MDDEKGARDNSALRDHVDEVARARGLTRRGHTEQTAVAQAAGLSHSGLETIYRGGTPKPDTLIKLATWADESPLVWFQLAGYISEGDIEAEVERRLRQRERTAVESVVLTERQQQAAAALRATLPADMTDADVIDLVGFVEWLRQAPQYTGALASVLPKLLKTEPPALPEPESHTRRSHAAG